MLDLLIKFAALTLTALSIIEKTLNLLKKQKERKPSKPTKPRK